METQPMERVELENGLNLEVYDLSRRVAADRWYVELKACIPIPVSEASFTQNVAAPTDIKTLREALGDQVVFEHRNTRNFIDENDKEAVMKEMRRSLKTNAERYFNHPDFAARFLLKQYKTFLSRPKGYPG